MSSEALLKYKASMCAKLLAESILSDEIKQALLENIDRATEEDLDNLLESLEKEQVELERLEKDLGEFEKEEDEQWQKLRQQQEDTAQRISDEFLADAIKSKM